MTRKIKIDSIVDGALQVGDYTLPDTDGTTGQSLTTDGSGGVSWADAAGGGSFEAKDSDTVIGEATAINQYDRDFVIGSPQLDDTGDSANDNRMFFDKSKGAFRAGNESSTDWDDINVGTESIALGTNVKASDDNTVAIGDGSEATDRYAIAIGRGNTASGYGSVAIGKDLIASGSHAFASGKGNVVSGDESFAANVDNTISGESSVGFGNNNTISGDNSIVTGQFANSSIRHAKVEGCSEDVDNDFQIMKFTYHGRDNGSGVLKDADGSSSQLVVPTDTIWIFSIYATAEGSGDTAILELHGRAENNGGTLEINQDFVNKSIYSGPLMDRLFMYPTASGTSLILRFFGGVENTITLASSNWIAEITIHQFKY